MLTALAFLSVNFASYFMALFRAPFWGLIAYANIYFNTPNPRLNWWANYLPFGRWSLITSAVLLASIAIHWKKTSDHEFSCAKWMPWFFVLSAIVSFTNALSPVEAKDHLYLFFTYGLIVFVLIKSITDFEKLRLFLLAIVGLTGWLSVMAFVYGERVHGRLEGIGTADANQSNEFALLIASVLPLVAVFVKSGKWYERAVSLLALPFIVNAFILCNSRGGMVALVGAIVGATILVADSQMRKKVILAMILAIPAFLYLTDDEFTTRVATLVGIGEAIEDEGIARNLSSGRTEIWLYGLEMASDHPLGVGSGGFSELARFYMPDEVLTYHPDAEYGTRSAHNSYLQVLVEQGVLGLTLWLGMCAHTVLVLRRSFKLASKQARDGPLWKEHVFAMNVAFFAVLLSSMVNSRIYYEFFWWQIALAVIVYSLLKKAHSVATGDAESESGKVHLRRGSHRVAPRLADSRAGY